MRLDFTTMAGLLIALGALGVGHVAEGGQLSSVLQPTAALIVFGGTLGAVVLQFPGRTLTSALREARRVFRTGPENNAETVNTIVSLSQKARRSGLVSLERDADAVTNPFLRRGLMLAVDGVEVNTLRSALDLEIARTEEENGEAARVFEAAGGYAPTVGILGAVLGLIHVMENLKDPGKLGAGIAVAFVATVYGVASANLLFLPIAGKIKARQREEIVAMEMILEGVCALAEGTSPRLIERHLEVYARERASGATSTSAGIAARTVRGEA